MKQLKIGILEFGYRDNIDAITCVNEIIEYAVESEQLGFSKFWLAEHYYPHLKNHAYTTPDVLIALIAGMTNKIEIGSAGSSVSLHSPLTLVTNYKFLTNLFDNRITLGLSKGIPDSLYSTQIMNKELNHQNSFEIFNENLKIIYNLIEDESKNLTINSTLIPPYGGVKPKLWYLSTSFDYFSDAIKYKLNYCISIFHNQQNDYANLIFNIDEVKKFKDNFYIKNGYLPKIAMSIAIILKETIEKAIYTLEIMELEFEASGSKRHFNIMPTTPEMLFKSLTEYQSEFGIDEFIIYDMSINNEEKLNNIQAISKIFNLLEH